MAGGIQHFQRVNSFCERRGGVFPFLVIRCSTCTRTCQIADGDKPMGMGRACRAFSNAGWRVAAARSGDQCPHCVAGYTKPSPRPASPSAAPAKPKDPIMVSTAQAAARPGVAAGVVADPPRQPTPKDINRIQTELQERYDSDAERYRGADSDRVVAERLDVPRAWVSAERARAYGPDRCEADQHDLSELQQIVERSKQMAELYVEHATQAEAVALRAQRAIDRLAARGVQ